MRKVIWGVVVVAMLAFGAVWWLFYANGAPDGRFALDLAAVRREAARLPGPGPVRVEVETVSHERVPKIAMVAGAGWGKVDLIRASYRPVWADGRTGIIDTTYDRATAGEVASFDDAAFARVRRAMTAANFIVVTHEHGDHLGGLKTAPNLAALMPHALLTPAQIAAPAGGIPSWPVGTSVTPFRYRGMSAIAPGIVLIAAPGHTPGSQWVYVRRADGKEIIFMGDTASMIDNVLTGQIRSHLVTDWMTHDDRAAVLRQVAALKEVAAANPGLALVPGHDAVAIGALARDGTLTPGFRF